jgi:zinc transport system ATP-binding protein
MSSGRAVGEPVLAAEDLSVHLGGVPVLRGINLQAGRGETVALMGGNGSGKSTLVRALLGLVPYQRGTVRLFGTEVRRFRGWARVGYVPQRSTVALTAAKVKEVVAAGRLARRRPFLPLRRSERAAVAEALAVVGMTERTNTEMTRLSGGQQQRVLIARALAGQPDLLVLDEPTAGVDLEHQRILAGVLETFVGSGRSVLVVLHEVGPLASLVDRAVVLREGRVVHDGPLGDLGRHHPADHHEFEEPAAGVGWLDGTIERRVSSDE